MTGADICFEGQYYKFGRGGLLFVFRHGGWIISTKSKETIMKVIIKNLQRKVLK